MASESENRGWVGTGHGLEVAITFKEPRDRAIFKGPAGYLQNGQVGDVQLATEEDLKAAGFIRRPEWLTDEVFNAAYMLWSAGWLINEGQAKRIAEKLGKEGIDDY